MSNLDRQESWETTMTIESWQNKDWNSIFSEERTHKKRWSHLQHPRLHSKQKQNYPHRLIMDAVSSGITATNISKQAHIRRRLAMATTRLTKMISIWKEQCKKKNNNKNKSESPRDSDISNCLVWVWSMDKVTNKEVLSRLDMKTTTVESG